MVLKWLWIEEVQNEDMLRRCLKGASSQTRSLRGLDSADV